jgi:predicted ATPase/transcriptional regulator with XRE-family HTH domain
MNTTNISDFRTSVKEYVQNTGQSQKALAAALNIDHTYLSQKLTGSKKLTHQDAKNIVKVLVEWEAIASVNEVVNLLQLAGCSDFSANDWGKTPLNTLTKPKEKSEQKEQTTPISIPTVRTNSIAHNLPSPLNAFMGRTEEVDRIKKLLLTPTARILTLTGPGGTGKTRLALEIARNLLPFFSDGVFFVDLASVRSEIELLDAVKTTLSIQSSAQISDYEAIKNFVCNKRLLLVLDNFEQLVEQDSSIIVSDFLKAAPELKVLITSRALLRIYGEQVYPVPTLTVPNPCQLEHLQIEDAISQYPAVELFIERARAANPRFTITNRSTLLDIVEICRRLDGLPLGIELAAARARVMTPKDILSNFERMSELASLNRDTPLRHYTLASTIEWSYALLSPEAKQVFEQLGVFAASFSAKDLTDIVVVPGADSEETLLDLVDNSLVTEIQSGEQKQFRLLETIKQWCINKLRTDGTFDDVQGRHANYYLRLVGWAESDLFSANYQQVLAVLSEKIDDIRNSLAWFLEQNQWLHIMKMAGILGRFWEKQGSFAEARYWLGIVVRYVEENAPGLLLEQLTVSKVVQMHALIFLRRGDYDQAKKYYLQSLEGYQHFGYKQGIADVLKSLGVTNFYQADYHSAAEYYEKALDLYRELSNIAGEADVLNNLAALRDIEGSYNEATSLFERSLALRQQLGNKQSVADSLNNLGVRAYAQFDYKRAQELLNESFLIYKELDSKQGQILVLSNIAESYLEQGNYLEAEKYYNDVLKLGEEIDTKELILIALIGLGRVFFKLKQYKKSKEHYQKAEILAENMGAKAQLADVYAGLGQIVARTGWREGLEYYRRSFEICDHYFLSMTTNFEHIIGIKTDAKLYKRATVLIGFLDTLQNSSEYNPTEVTKKEQMRLRDRCLEELGETAYNSSYARGATLDLESAISFAISTDSEGDN